MASLALLMPIANAAQDNAEFNPVVVYGAGFGEPVEQALPQTEVISNVQIRKSGLNTVGDILEKVGNVYMRQDLSGNMNTSPDIRGYGATASNNTVILIDGVKISQNEQAPARIWNVPVEAIDHIEIIRGSSSVLYGEGATSGVINIITNKQKDNIGVVSVGAGSYGTYTTNAYASKNLDNLKISVFGKTVNSNGYRDQSSSNLRSGGINLDYQVQNNLLLGFKYGEDKNYTLLPGYLTLTKYAQNPTQAQSALTSLYNDQAVNSTGRGKLTSAYLKYRESDSEYLLDVSRRDSSTDYFNTSWYEDDLYKSRQDAINAKVKLSNFLLQSNTAIFGMGAAHSYRNNSSNALENASWYQLAGLASIGFTSQNSNAYFVQDDWKLTDIDRVTVGYRKEYFRQNASSIGTDLNYATPYTQLQSGKNDLNAYEFQYSRELSKGINNYIKFGQSYRLPNVDDLSGHCGYQLSCSTGLILNPQVNKDLEVGSVYNVGSNRGYLKLYRSIITNEILFDKSSSGELGYNVNVPKSKRQGVEVSNSYKYNNDLSVNSSVNLIDAVFLTDTFGAMTGVNGKRISGTPNYVLGLGFDYSIDAHNALSWKTRVVGNQYSQGDNANLYKLGSYSVTDLSYRWSEKNWSLTANVNNIFDKKYFDTSILAASNSSARPYVVYPNFNRNFMLTAKYSFE